MYTDLGHKVLNLLTKSQKICCVPPNFAELVKALLCVVSYTHFQCFFYKSATLKFEAKVLFGNKCTFLTEEMCLQ